MIPSAFDYAAPSTVDEVLAALAEAGDEAKILGGGQSLLPVLRLRLAAPGLLIDLHKVPELRGIRAEGDRIIIGAMTTHHEVATNGLVGDHLTLLGQTAATVADQQIRYRGTLGGSLAHADPAGDMGAAAIALEATMEIAGPSGTRSVPATEFFTDYFETALAEDEILTSISFDKHTGWGTTYEKFTQIAQAWSVVAVAAAVQVEGGVISQARIGLTNMGATPLRASAMEAALTGGPATPEAIAAASLLAAEGTSPVDDAGGTADYRRHLVTVLARRAVITAVG